MNEREVLNVALEAGEILLVSGAEIYRVEDTIGRICKSYGMNSESVVLPTGIFISLTGKNGKTLSMTKRIRDRDIDLHRIELVNSFSRNLQKVPLSYGQAVDKLHYIRRKPPFKLPIRILAAGVIAFVFTLLFKGKVMEAVPAFFISMFIYIIREQISRVGFFKFFEFFVSGMFAAMLSFVSANLGSSAGLNAYRILIGSIIMLLPGLAITNGIKDALYGDIVSSLSGLGEAILIAAAVGAGAGIVLWAQFYWF